MSDLHRDPTEPFMLDDWNANYVPGLLAQHLANTVMAEWANPHSHVLKFSGKPSQKTEGIRTAKGGINLERDVQKAHMEEMVR